MESYIYCQVRGERIYENQQRIQPNGGVIHCVRCWRQCMKTNHDFCGRKKGIDFSGLNLDDPLVLRMMFKK